MRVVFDLDGTLALNEHRVHHIRTEPKNYDAFFAECVNDLPNWPAIRTLWAHLKAGHNVEIWSGRSDQVRQETELWLLDNVFAHRDLVGSNGQIPAAKYHKHIYSHLARMRQAGDHQPDTRLKRTWLHEARAIGRAPDLVYDDRDCVVEMWREEGVPCFQVAPGPF